LLHSALTERPVRQNSSKDREHNQALPTSFRSEPHCPETFRMLVAPPQQGQ
jgi:hypothetical protein